MSKTKQELAVQSKYLEDLKFHLFKALDIDPKYAEAHFQLALIYQGNGNKRETEFHFKKAIASNSKTIRELVKGGDKLLKNFQFQHANNLFMKAQRKKHHCAKVNYELSNFYINQNKLDLAQTCLENSIELHFASAKSHRNLGILLFNKKKYDTARIHIEKALDLDYSDHLSHLNLGLIMKHGKDYLNAELHLLIAMEIKPKFSISIFEMALLQLIMKNQLDAKKYYEKVLENATDTQPVELDKDLRQQPATHRNKNKESGEKR